jgi:hypothetical protein
MLIREKKKVCKSFKSTGLNSYYTEFSTLRKKCKFLSELFYANYLDKLQTSLSNNPKSFWKFVQNRQKINIIPNNITYGTSIANNIDETVNMFKSYFESVFSPTNKSIIYSESSKSEINFSNCGFTVTKIFEAFQALSNGYKSGPDLIPEIIYHNCHYTLSRPIHFLFNLSLSSGFYPTKWKKNFNLSSI